MSMSRSLGSFIISDITAFVGLYNQNCVLNMPKLPSSKLERNISFVLKFLEEFEKRDKELFCKLCKTPVSSEKKTRVDSHRECEGHKRKLPRLANRLTADSFELTAAEKIMKALLKADIPLHKLRHPALRNLFEEKIVHLPGAETCRSAVKGVFKKKCHTIISNAF